MLVEVISGLVHLLGSVHLFLSVDNPEVVNSSYPQAVGCVEDTVFVLVQHHLPVLFLLDLVVVGLG